MLEHTSSHWQEHRRAVQARDAASVRDIRTYAPLAARVAMLYQAAVVADPAGF